MVQEYNAFGGQYPQMNDRLKSTKWQKSTHK
jgi:hypothetical protein